MSLEEWKPGNADVCSALQLDISCLVDGELDEPAAARAMVHLEDCPACRGFFDDARRCARLHRDIADPQRLMAHVAALTGGDLADLTSEARTADLTHRLATIFYQLGKAYVLAAIDPGFRERIFEQAVPLDETQSRGRGFVDGVVAGSRESERSEWREARHMLNGRLEQIQDPLDKGRRLLEEALGVEPAHEEAGLYLAFLHSQEGRTLKAAQGYRSVFDSALSETNRGLAAVQLGRLYSSEDDFRRAIPFFRWVTMSGLADRDDRFWFARFNLGSVYARKSEPERALKYFRELIDRHPAQLGNVVEAFAQAPKLRQTIDSQPGFTEALVHSCPELFHPTGASSTDLEGEEL